MSFGAIAAGYFTLAGGGGSSQYADEILADAPLAFYRFDETSGTTMVDSSGNGRDGAYVNAPTLGQYNILTGDDGHSASFQGSTNGEKATISYASWMNVPAMTIMTTCFVEPQALRIVASRYTDVGNDWSWFLYTSGSKFMLYYRSSGGTNYQIDSGVTVSPGVKYFVAAYVGAAGAGLRVYTESGLIASATGPGATLNSSSRNLVLMDCDPPNAYPMSYGYLDGLAYFGTALSTGRIDQLAGYALAPSAKWLNRSAGVSARNGTTSHTITFTAATAGSLLVAIISMSGVATASTPGWTKRFGVNSTTELSVFTRNASAGDTNLSLTVSASNVPLHYAVYEFPAGSSWYSSATSTFSSAYPQLAGLPGTPVTVFAAASARRLSGDASASAAWRYFWNTDFVQETIHNGVTQGVFTTIGYFSDLRDTTADVTYPTEQFIENMPNAERALFALILP